ncbi:MAG: NAD(P)H-dependent glycerol-3-phosphate dehydrogenase [Thermotogota bacterium]
MKICVLGFGSWGTSISNLLALKKHKIISWTKDERIIESMRWHENPYYFPGRKLPETIQITNDLNKATSEAEMIVIAIPTQAIRPVLAQINLSGKTIINLSKGIEIKTGQFIHQICQELFGDDITYCSLSGPTHAEEVMEQIPTNIVAASNDCKVLTDVQKIFTNDSFRVYTNDDIIGVELCGALKNIYAIAAGIIDGLGPWDNTKAALITRALMEMRRLGENIGAKRETFMGLSGIGDMIVTCTSKHSRNRFVGEAIGKGGKIQNILHDLNMVAEGVYTVKALMAFLKVRQTEMPIAQKIYQVIYENSDPLKCIKELMERELKPEFW